MTDKVQKIRNEVEKLKSQLLRGACSSQIAMETRCKEEAYNEVLAILDTMQEEPVNRTPADVESAMQEVEEKARVFTEAHQGEDADTILAQMRGEEPVSKDYRERYKRITQSEQFKKSYEGMSVGEAMPIEGEEPVSEDFEEASKEWLRPQLDKSYANYGEAKMMELTHFDGYAMFDAIEFGAKWQKEQIEEALLSEVLPCFMHGGEADEVVAKLDEVLNQKK